MNTTALQTNIRRRDPIAETHDFDLWEQELTEEDKS